MTLPTDRTTANTAAEHVADHNTLHAEHNVPTHNHSGAYVSSDSFYIPAAQMVFDGAAVVSLNVDSAWIVRVFPDAAARQLVGSLVVPAGWATCRFSAHWANVGAGAGNVQLRGDFGQGTTGSTMARQVVGTAVTAAAGGTNVLQTTVLGTGIAVTPGNLASFVVIRLGSDAADTLAADMHLYGLLVEKVT